VSMPTFRFVEQWAIPMLSKFPVLLQSYLLF